MPRTSPFSIQLSSAEEAELLRRAGKYTLPYFQVQRAKMILSAAEGLNNDEIAARLDSRCEVVGRVAETVLHRSSPGIGRAGAAGPSPDFFPQISSFRLKPGLADCRRPTICRCLAGVAMTWRVRFVRPDWWRRSVEVPSGGGYTKTQSGRGITAAGSFRAIPILLRKPVVCWIFMPESGKASL
jgi:hypothetical protein